MNRNISEELKKEIVSEYMNTRRQIKRIAEKYKLPYEDVIYILEDYQSAYGSMERNPTKIKSADNNSKEMKELVLAEVNQMIYELREKRLSCAAISKQLKEQGIVISAEIVRKRCKEIYAAKGEIEPKAKTNTSKRIIDENQEENKRIFELREQGFSYRKIVRVLEEEGIKTTIETVRKRCKKLYELKGNKEPKSRKKIIVVDNDEIYNLREKGLTYKKIAEDLKEQGIKISSNSVRTICKEIYAIKGETEPKLNKGNPKRIVNENQELEEKVYELREKNLSYKQIMEHLDLQGIQISEMTIFRICKNIYKLKGKNQPELRKIVIDADEIYNLRQQGLSYRGIVEKLEEQGIKTSNTTVRKICKKIYGEKGEEEPVILGGRQKVTDEISGIKEKVYELREKGLYYREILKDLELQGIQISESSVRKICRELYSLNDEIESEEKENKEVSEQQLSKAILNLITTRKATLEQVKVIADYYGVDLEKTMNSLEEQENSSEER